MKIIEERVGYATHLFLDALNPSRVPMLYPYEKKFGIGLIRTIPDRKVSFSCSRQGDFSGRICKTQ